MDFDINMETNVIHCNNPEENPLPRWLRQKAEKASAADILNDPSPAPVPVFPSFCLPLRKYREACAQRFCLDPRA